MMSRDTGRVCAWRVCRSERIGRLAPGLARGGQGWISVPLDPPGAIAGKQSRIPHLAQWGTQANCNSSRRRPGRMTSVGIFSRVDAEGNRHPVQDPVRSGGTQSGWRRNGRTHLCRGSSSGRCQHQPRCLLADHDRRRIGVARGQGRHDRGIGDAQARQAAHTKLVVDHRHRVRTHLARAGRCRRSKSPATRSRASTKFARRSENARRAVTSEL